MAAGRLGQDPVGLREADVRALPDGEVAQGLGDVCLADAHGSEQDTDSPAWSQRRAARSRISAAGSFGEAAKSNSSRVTCCSNFAFCKRRWKATVAGLQTIAAPYTAEADRTPRENPIAAHFCPV